jgi:hypothetical protein
MKADGTMVRFISLVVIPLLVLCASGCTRGHPTSERPAAEKPGAPPSSAAPADVSHGDKPDVAARCTYHPNESIASLARTLPAGSVDTVDLHDPMTGLMLVIVEVTVTPTPRSAPSRFITTFRLPSGVELQKPWQGATGNRSGAFRAILTVPVDARYVATAIAS